MLKFVSNVSQLFAADDFSRRNFSDAFLLGALRVNVLAKGHNALKSVKLEPAAPRSRVKHSTTTLPYYCCEILTL